MKKIFSFILILAVLPVLCYGQLNANRTANTRVSDALAMLPARDAATLTYAMEDLVTAGAEGMAILTGMFDNVNNVPVNYALNGLAFYVTGPGREAARQTFERALTDAFNKNTDREVRRFYLALLGKAGTDASVEFLAAHIEDNDLGLPALDALVKIGTPAAKNAVRDAIIAGKGDRTALANAAGFLGVDAIYETLRLWLDDADNELKEAVYYAMSRGSDTRALSTLDTAARNDSYAKTPATLNYIAALGELKDTNNKEVVKRAKELMAKGKANGDVSLRLAALDTYVLAGGKGASDLIVKALDDPERQYRMGALDLGRGNDAIYAKVTQRLPKLKTGAARADAIYFLGHSDIPPYTAFLLPYVLDADEEVSISAMEAVTRLSSPADPELNAAFEEPSVVTDVIAGMLGGGVPEALVSVLDRGLSEKRIDVAKRSLLSYKGDVTGPVAGLLDGNNNTSPQGRIAALEILAGKRAYDHAELIFAETENPDKAVSAAAYKALPYVVSQSDLPELYRMLETADAANAPYLQDAVVNVVAGMPVNARLSAVKNRMEAAGAKRPLYFVPLTSTGDVLALGPIAEAYRQGNFTDKEEAVKALRSWKGPEAAQYLYEIAKSDNNGDALNGYIDAAVRNEMTPERKLLMLSAAAGLTKSNSVKERLVREAGKLHIFQSLIFAGGFLDEDNAKLRDLAAQAVMNIALTNTDWNGPVVTDLLNKASAALNNPDADYNRQAITKHLGELRQDGGFVSLFNGTDLTGWKGIVENPIKRAKMSSSELARKQAVADELMRKNWVVEDGSIVYIGDGYDNICTVGEYSDFEMYLDWRIYPEDIEADGGLYLRGYPQVQIWRTDRADVGSEVGSGGLYNNQKHESKPLVYADNELGEWNTFRITMKGDRVSVWLNGDLVVDNVVLENFWDRKEPLLPIGQIELQGHTTRIAHKNIYIKELPMAEPYQVSAEEHAEGFVELFDGINMDNWYGNTEDYIAEDGAIVLYPSKGSGGNLYTKEEYGDFIMRFEFMLTPGANNGIGIRTPDKGDAAYVGMEIQVLDDDAQIYSNLEQWQYHGSVYGIIAAKRGHLKPMGEWNYQEIYANGNHIRVTLNGVVIVDGDIAEASKNGTLDGKNHPGLLNKKGHLAFLGHGSHVKFRNLRIKVLD